MVDLRWSVLLPEKARFESSDTVCVTVAAFVVSHGYWWVTSKAQAL
jgi:hypothetical protein